MIVAVPVHWIHWADPADRQALNHWAPGKWMRIASGRRKGAWARKCSHVVNINDSYDSYEY